MVETIRMADARREHLQDWLAALEEEHRLGIHRRSAEALTDYEQRMEYLRSRLGKFRSDEETLAEVEARDFGWTPSGYVQVRPDSHICVGEYVRVRIKDATAEHVRAALAFEKSRKRPTRVQVDYLESRLPRFQDETETLLALEQRLGWLGPPRDWSENEES